MRIMLVAAITAPALTALVATNAAGQTITDLGVIGGYATSRAFAVNADGTVVVGFCADASGTNQRAFRWTVGGGMQDLGTLSGLPKSFAKGVSADGQSVAVGLESAAGARYGARWTPAGGLVGLASPVTASSFSVNAISANGQVIVGDNNAASTTALRWTSAGGIQSLGQVQVGGTNSHATAAVPDGSKIVGWGWRTASTLDGRCGFQWTPATTQAFGLYFGSDTYIYAVTPDGATTAGAYGAGAAFAVRRVDTGSGVNWTPLGVLPGRTTSTAFGITADGNTIVGQSSGGGPAASAGFLWTNSLGIKDLNTYLAGLGVDLSGWYILDAFALTPDGSTIVGSGLHGPSGGVLRAYRISGINCASAPTVFVPPTSVHFCSGGAAAVGVFASPGCNYQWQVLVNGVWTNLTNAYFGGGTAFGFDFTVGNGAQAATMNLANLSVWSGTTDIRFRCMVTNACGANAVATTTAVLTADYLPTFLSQPASVAQCNVQPATFFIQAVGSTALTYQWQRRDPTTLAWQYLSNGPGVDFNTGLMYTVSGAQSLTMTFDIAALGINPPYSEFRCIVQDACGAPPPKVVTQTWRECPYVCPADFDGSGGVPDAADAAAFWAAWLAGDDCADVDCSGGAPDAGDVQYFYSLWLAGGCDSGPCPSCP